MVGGQRRSERFTRVNEYYTFHTGSVHLPKRVPGGRRLHIRAPASPTNTQRISVLSGIVWQRYCSAAQLTQYNNTGRSSCPLGARFHRR